MNILFVSGELIGSALCQKLKKEGHAVRLYIQDEHRKNCLENIVDKVAEWRSQLEWVGKEGLIIFDDVGFGEEQDKLRKEGYKVFGGSKGGDDLEIDRALGQRVLHGLGMRILPSFNFRNLDSAIEFLAENKGKWVIKQASHESSLNYVGEMDDASDVIEKVYMYKELGIKKAHLQKKVEGIEVGVARYFNGNDWVGPIEINHEHKRFLDGDKGPLTPEMGTVLWYTEHENNLYKETLAKLKPYLQKINFRGDVDINCIINERGVWPLELTPRLGSPSTEIQIELHNSPWSEFAEAVATGASYSLDYKKSYGICVCLTIPPFPFKPTSIKSKEDCKNIRINIHDSLTESEMEHVRFEEASKDESGYYCSGNYGWVLHVTASHPDLAEARKKVYGIVEKIKMPDMKYRKDIGERVLLNELPTLKAQGWI